MKYYVTVEANSSKLRKSGAYLLPQHLEKWI